MTTLKESEVTANLRATTTNLSYDEREVFTDDKNHTIKYRTLSWQSAAYIMACEARVQTVQPGAIGWLFDCRLYLL